MRKAYNPKIESFVENGGNLLISHAGAWYNWKDWPFYNASIVGGGSRSHEALQKFKVVIEKDHPITKGVDKEFVIKDELYRSKLDKSQVKNIEILAYGKSLKTGKQYPVVWITYPKKGKGVVVNTLGHDDDAHTEKNYQKLLKNTVKWLRSRK